MSKSAVIGLVESDEDKVLAEEFIRHNALKWYACDPPPPTQILFAAKIQRDIVGTIGFDFSDGVAPFRLEHAYDFDYRGAPWSFERKKLAQYSRWMANAPNVSFALIHHSAVYALAQGRQYGFGETKPLLMSLLWKFGMDVKVIPHHAFHIKRIPEDARNYYSKPSVLFMMDLAQVKEGIEKTMGIR